VYGANLGDLSRSPVVVIPALMGLRNELGRGEGGLGDERMENRHFECRRHGGGGCPAEWGEGGGGCRVGT